MANSGQGRALCRCLKGFGLVWLVLVLGRAPLPAELVLLVDGGVLKVAGFYREGESMRLLLPSGGTLTVSLLRIERILADEIDDTFDPHGLDLGAAIEFEFADGHDVPETPFGWLIFEMAKQHRINPRLIAAMVETESAFDPAAVSIKGATGLLQLMPATADRFGVTTHELTEPARNLEAGMLYLRWLKERFEGDLVLMLASYNAGEATVDRYGGVPPYRETREYIRRVYSAAAE